MSACQSVTVRSACGVRCTSPTTTMFRSTMQRRRRRAAHLTDTLWVGFVSWATTVFVPGVSRRRTVTTSSLAFSSHLRAGGNHYQTGDGGHSSLSDICSLGHPTSPTNTPSKILLYRNIRQLLTSYTVRDNRCQRGKRTGESAWSKVEGPKTQPFFPSPFRSLEILIWNLPAILASLKLFTGARYKHI